MSRVVGFCTLAIHAPYRQRARLLARDLIPAPVIVLTDAPEEFADLPVRAVHHTPTGPMAIDYLERLPPTGQKRGGAAYHDKRFALQLALEEFETAIFFDADTRVEAVPELAAFPPGLSVTPLVRSNLADWLSHNGTWRLPTFTALAKSLFGSDAVLRTAPFCHESPIAIRRGRHLDRFFWAWSYGAEFFQSRHVYSGEGGVIGLAAAYAGWTVDYDALGSFEPLIRHESGGPKTS